MANPEGANVKGLWSDPKFLQASGDPSPKYSFNSTLNHVQLADFHGHGWLFRYVWKMDTYGNLLDRDGHKVAENSAYRWKKAVKLQDIHSEYGMQCADCISRVTHTATASSTAKCAMRSRSVAKTVMALTRNLRHCSPPVTPESTTEVRSVFRGAEWRAVLASR